MSKNLTARDVMESDVLTVRDTLPLDELARQLSERRISGAPVLDRHGKLVGVISSRDLVRGPHEAEIMLDEYLDGYVAEPGVLVQDLMTPVVHRVEETTPLAAVVELMVKERIHRVIVVRGEELAGILTTMDLLRTLGRLLQ